MYKIGNNLICQVGIIVNDIEKIAGNYSKIFGMKMPAIIVTDAEEKAQTRYRGEPTKARAKLAFFNMGQVQLELIEPDEHPSTWREFLDAHGQGIHHIAFIIKGMNEVVAYLENNGMPLVQKGEYTGGRYAYMDSVPKLGAILELLEND